MRPTSGPRFGWKRGVGEYLTWVRFVEEPRCHPAVALLAMGDALPPAAMALFSEFGPISSMNWTVNMLTGAPATDDGWWLLRSEHTSELQSLMRISYAVFCLQKKNTTETQAHE